MIKTLAESAAEILKQSIAASKKDTDEATNQAIDLGGATNDNPGGDAVGSAAASTVKEAPKPGSSNTDDAEKTPPKTQGLAKPVVGSVEPGLGEEVESDADEENDINSLIEKYKDSMAEDVEALFNGESLSEEFKTKAITIFEAAVMSRVTAITEEIIEQNDATIEEQIEEIKTELTEQLDSYLSSAVQEWITENKVAIETGLRVEIVEGFLGGLKNLFVEHYVEIPDEKIDVTEELAMKVAELDEQIKEKNAQVAEIQTELNESKKRESIRKLCEGLTEVQIAKMTSLAESVEFTTEGEFEAKLSTIRENYFPNNKTVTSEIANLEEDEQKEEVVANPAMDRYVQAISSKIVRK